MVRKNEIEILKKRIYNYRYYILGIIILLWISYHSKIYDGISNYFISFIPIRKVQIPVPVVIIDKDNERRINIRSRGALGSWKNLGIVYSESKEDDTIFSIWGQETDPRRGRYNYQIREKTTGLTIQLNGGNDMNMLNTGDKVDIVGKESIGQFIVELNNTPELRYI